MFDQNLNFRANLEFSTQFWIFHPNFNFGRKLRFRVSNLLVPPHLMDSRFYPPPRLLLKLFIFFESRFSFFFIYILPWGPGSRRWRLDLFLYFVWLVNLRTKIRTIFLPICFFYPKVDQSVTKIWIFDQNLNIRPKFEFSTKIRKFGPHLNFRPKF